MTAINREIPDASRERQRALARWDYEGGAGTDDPQEGSIADDGTDDVPPITNAELVQLRVRVIALENPVITLLEGVRPAADPRA